MNCSNDIGRKKKERKKKQPQINRHLIMSLRYLFGYSEN